MNLQAKNIHVLLVIISILFYQPVSMTAAAGQDAQRDYINLMAAAIRGNAQVVQNLIDKKVDIHRRDETVRMNALELALEGDKYDIADLLIAAGADVNCPMSCIFSRDTDSPSYFQYSIMQGDLKKVLYCINRDKRCIDYINKKVIINGLKGSSLVGFMYEEEKDSRHAEVLQALLSYNINLDDLAIETADDQDKLFGKTIEQVIREKGTPAMVEILDRHITALRKQGNRGMQEEFDGKLFNEIGLEGMLGHFAELDVLANYVKSKQ